MTLPDLADCALVGFDVDVLLQRAPIASRRKASTLYRLVAGTPQNRIQVHAAHGDSNCNGPKISANQNQPFRRVGPCRS